MFGKKKGIQAEDEIEYPLVYVMSQKSPIRQDVNISMTIGPEKYIDFSMHKDYVGNPTDEEMKEFQDKCEAFVRQIPELAEQMEGLNVTCNLSGRCYGSERSMSRLISMMSENP